MKGKGRFRQRSLRRGYKVDEVDAFLDRVEATLNGDRVDPAVKSADIHEVVFHVRFGGYDEWQVDLHLDRLERQLADQEPASDRAPERLAPDRLSDRPSFGGERLPERTPGGAGNPFGGPGPSAGGPGFAGAGAGPGGPGPSGTAPSGLPMRPTPERVAYDRGPGPGARDERMMPPAAAGPQGGRPGGPGAGGPGPGGPGVPPPGMPQAGPPPGYQRFEAPPGFAGGFGDQRPEEYGNEPTFAGFERPSRPDMTSEMRMPPPASGPGYGQGPGAGGPGAGGPGAGGPGYGAPGSSRPAFDGSGPAGPGPGGPGFGGPGAGGPGGPGAGGPGAGGPGSSGSGFGGPGAGGPGFAGQGGAGGPGAGPGGAAPTEVQRVDQMRRTFQQRRFGSGYDRVAVDRLFEDVLNSMTGRAAPMGEAALDPQQFELVPGGYFESEVDQALREVRDILRRR